ncbi:hypothetical protein evm_008352 [Chilo suppressalis]|nr:hypothetical protein evm_008352 [Chilo suppressalis]
MFRTLPLVRFSTQLSQLVPCVRVSIRLVNNFSPITKSKHAIEQMDYIKSAVSSDEIDWPTVRSNTLQIPGSVNEKNLDAIFLKAMINAKQFDAALSYVEYLKRINTEFNLGCTNSILFLFYEIGKINELTTEQKSFILNSYESLYEKYKVLDSMTCDRLLHALCVIHEWKKALKVLDDLCLSSRPSHSSYSTLVATLFDNNKKGEALKLIERSICDSRPLQTIAYLAWINYILKKYKQNQTKLKYLEEIFWHIFDNSVIINEETAQNIQDVYTSLGWNANVTKIAKVDGQCSYCREKLDCLKIGEEEFLTLQKNIKDKLIVGSDLFLKTTPQELDKFLKFIHKMAPFDIVLDALNIAYVARKGAFERVNLLSTVVDYFTNRNKKILLLGRKHMLYWPKKVMSDIMSKTCYFFTDDLTQDDPYFITAAVLSGMNTDIVSKDLLRGHRFLLKDKKLALAFRRWQWQHQWMVFINNRKKLIIQPPLQFTPCAQKKDNAWHLPFEKEDATTQMHMNDGTPDLNSWLCLRPPVTQ